MKSSGARQWHATLSICVAFEADRPWMGVVMSDTVKYVLDEARIPTHWYNLLADLSVPPPPVLHPGTLKPVGPDDLAPLFPMSLIMQEVSTEREIEIPEPVRDVYKQW